MSYLGKIQNGIDYIEANLDSDISLAKVACIAGISQWHFQRIFKALTNETLKTYIRSRRLANSLEKLLHSDNRIIDIAIEAGFESQQSFSRVFKQAFEITPNQYRKLGNKHLFLKKIKFNTEYLEHINQNVSLEPEIVLQKKMILIGMKTSFYSIDSDKNNIAEKLPPLWEDFLTRVEEIKHIVHPIGYGVIKQSKDNPELLDYYAAFEVSQLAEIPLNMVSIEIPESTYAKFTHKGNVKGLNNTVNYIYSSWLLQSGKKHTYAADLEFYAEDYHPTSNNSVMYYSIPVTS